MTQQGQRQWGIGLTIAGIVGIFLHPFWIVLLIIGIAMLIIASNRKHKEENKEYIAK